MTPVYSCSFPSDTVNDGSVIRELRERAPFRAVSEVRCVKHWGNRFSLQTTTSNAQSCNLTYCGLCWWGSQLSIPPAAGRAPASTIFHMNSMEIKVHCYHGASTGLQVTQDPVQQVDDHVVHADARLIRKLPCEFICVRRKPRTIFSI